MRAVLYTAVALGILVFFLVLRKFAEVRALFDRLPRYCRIAVILGFLLFLPVSFLVGYFGIWVGGGSVCSLGEWIAGGLSTLPVAALGKLLGVLLCSVGVLIGITLGFLGGFVFVAAVGESLIVLLCFLAAKLRSTLFDGTSSGRE